MGATAFFPLSDSDSDACWAGHISPLGSPPDRGATGLCGPGFELAGTPIVNASPTLAPFSTCEILPSPILRLQKRQPNCNHDGNPTPLAWNADDHGTAKRVNHSVTSPVFPTPKSLCPNLGRTVLGRSRPRTGKTLHDYAGVTKRHEASFENGPSPPRKALRRLASGGQDALGNFGASSSPWSLYEQGPDIVMDNLTESDPAPQPPTNHLRLKDYSPPPTLRKILVRYQAPACSPGRPVFAS